MNSNSPNQKEILKLQNVLQIQDPFKLQRNSLNFIMRKKEKI